MGKSKRRKRSRSRARSGSRRRHTKGRPSKGEPAPPPPPLSAEDAVTRLMTLARANSAADVVELIRAHGLPVDSHRGDGLTALHVACAEGSVEAARALLDLGAAVNAVGPRGNTPLHYAVQHDRGAAVALLMQRGANAAQPNESGDTPRSLGLLGVLRHHLHTMRSGVGAEDAPSEEAWQRRMQRESVPLRGGLDDGAGAAPTADGWSDADDASEGPDGDWFEDIAEARRRRFQRKREEARRAAPPQPQPQPQPQPHPRAPHTAAPPPPPHVPPTAAAASEATLEESEGVRSRHDAAWAAFSAGSADAVRLSDVPWPHGDAGAAVGAHHLGVHPSLPTADRRAVIRQLLLRWHPDKFEQRFGSALHTEDRAEILARVKHIAQLLTDLNDAAV